MHIIVDADKKQKKGQKSCKCALDIVSFNRMMGKLTKGDLRVMSKFRKA